MDAPVAPDRQDIARHLRLLFAGQQGFVALRVFPEKGTDARGNRTPFLPIGPGLIEAAHQHAIRAPETDHGVFVVPGPIPTAGRAKAQDVIATGVVLVDLDHGDIDAKQAHLVRFLGEPALDVASGGITAEGQAKRHLYWRLAEPATGPELTRACEVRAAIAAKVGGDPSFASAHQPIRLAGSIHKKNGKASLVCVIGEADGAHTLDELVRAVAAMPSMEGLGGPGLPKSVRYADRPAPTELMQRAVREGGVDGVTRFATLSSVMGHWIRLQRLGSVDADEAWKAVSDFNTACVRPPWDKDRLRREFEALQALDATSHLPKPNTGTESVADLSEDSLAGAFAAQHRTDWRYVAGWGKWLRWTGTHWRVDEVGEVLELIRQVCRASLKPDSTNGERRRIKSDKTIRAVERILRTDPVHATTTEAWDASSELLNTPAGQIDLRTGELQPHDRGALITRITRGSPGAGTTRWKQFISEITGDDRDLAGYLARVAGYCLSGDTSEQAFFFLHGAGANGKSVFISVISEVMGAYAATAPLDTFMASRSDRHPTDLAGLRGARLVSVNETESGRAWSEARIKAITGGDRLRVRLMHQDFFEFTPVFKLMVAGNHRPRLENVGEAMRRRLHLVPFEVTIPADRRDKQLVEKLCAERDGILGWMLEGHAEWRRIGLAPPEAILKAGSAYFEDEDVVGQWIAEACVVGSSMFAPSATLYASFKDWAEARGLEPGSQRGLGEALRQRGFADDRRARARIWKGIAVRAGAACRREAAE